MNEQAEKEEAAKKKKQDEEKRQKERLKYFNEFDGLIHQPDGSREFLEGGIVSGVNNLMQKKKIAPAPKPEPSADEEIEQAKKEEMKELNDKENKKKAQEEARKERMKRFNPADGLIHNKDGSTEFVEGGIVEGANSLVQKKHSHHKHHKHHHKKVDTNEETLQEKE